jgi:hypothetical protein
MASPYKPRNQRKLRKIATGLTARIPKVPRQGPGGGALTPPSGKITIPRPLNPAGLKKKRPRTYGGRGGASKKLY